MTIAPAQNRAVPKFVVRVLLPVVAVTLTAVLLAAFGLYWASTRSNAVSVERQIRATHLALSGSLDELAVQQEVAAVWEDPVIKLDKKRVDWRWIDKNIGTWMYDIFRHDQVYVINGKDKPVYAMAEGKRGSPETYATVSDYIKRLIDDVRGRSTRPNHTHERLPGRELHPASTVRTSGNAVHSTDLVEVLERPAAVSVMRMDDPDGTYRSPKGSEYLHISIRFLDSGYLQEVAKRNLIEAPRFSRVPTRGEGEHAVPLVSDNGDLIGYFFWRPELPGTAVLHALAPVATLSAALIILIMTMLSRWLRWSMRKQEAMMVELQASEAQAQHLAFHDVLTGLPNRALFNECLDQGLTRARRRERIAVLLLDLDRFKNVNDTLGHIAGDALIREFGSRLTKLVGERDTVARLGGDEFAILAIDAANVADIPVLCERILEAMRHPFVLFGNLAYVGVSIGVTIAPDAGLDRGDLLRKADIALYRAKGEGRNCYRVFTHAMDESVKLRGTIEEELRVALAAGQELVVYYQPQVAGANQKVVGLEALVRWQHPTRGLISPEQFVPVAEETGLICQLGEWVLREACYTARRWPDLFVAVNLSPMEIRSNAFADRTLAIIRESGADPTHIELEVTESVLLKDDDEIHRTLKHLRAAGVRIALDDFGTGYSSLSYLRRFQVDKIKIDRSFIQQLGYTADSAAIVTAVVTLGHALGLSVTAEGVETGEQSDFLVAVGCNVLQGYLFSRAVPAEEIASLLLNPRRVRVVA
jgi:diguanylate cyclase (GGDEF)-like protein